MSNNYIFLTDEGYTFQPNSYTNEPDIENLQVIGISCGETQKKAFENLLKENPYLLKTSFNKVICYKLDNDYKEDIGCFFINAYR
mgnify:FL=1